MSSKWNSDLILNMFPLCFWLNPQNLIWRGRWSTESIRDTATGAKYLGEDTKVLQCHFTLLGFFQCRTSKDSEWNPKSSSRFQRFQKKKFPISEKHVEDTSRSFAQVTGLLIWSLDRWFSWTLRALAGASREGRNWCLDRGELQNKSKISLFSIETYDLFLKIPHFHPFPTKFGDLEYLRFWVKYGWPTSVGYWGAEDVWLPRLPWVVLPRSTSGVWILEPWTRGTHLESDANYLLYLGGKMVAKWWQ
jgi:hypothetical protein